MLLLKITITEIILEANNFNPFQTTYKFSYEVVGPEILCRSGVTYILQTWHSDPDTKTLILGDLEQMGQGQSLIGEV